MKAREEQAPDLAEITSPDEAIAELLLAGTAQSVAAAEEIYLNNHLDDVLKLVSSDLSEAEFRCHPLISLLISHGSRGWDDALD
jgi:hypothetical protein